MKKTILVLLIVMMTGLFTVVNASGTITERGDIQISIDGTVSTYVDPPIVVDGRTLVPLRALLTNLGVTNDDQHIIWNNEEQSVTVIKDSTKIYLVVGKTEAKINNIGSAIDVAPIAYNSRVYIPARFVAEAFGMNVAWNGDTKSILITSQTEIESNNGKFTAMLPYNWEKVADLDPVGDFEAQTKTEYSYIVTLMESSLDFTSFESWKSTLLEQTLEAYPDAVPGTPSNITIGGNAAVQYIFPITEDGVNMKFILTYIRGSNYYGQVVCVCTVSEYSSTLAECTQIMNSIKGL